MTDLKKFKEYQKSICTSLSRRADVELIYETYRGEQLLFKNKAGQVGNMMLRDHWQYKFVRFTDDYLQVNKYPRLRDVPEQNIKSGDWHSSFEFTCAIKETDDVFEYIMDNYFEVKELPNFEITDITREILRSRMGKPLSGYLWTNARGEYRKEIGEFHKAVEKAREYVKMRREVR